jgi:hypothetical protein
MTLLSYEESIDNAPVVKLSNGEQCIPQHYFRYKHTLSSVQEVVCDIQYCSRYPVFVCQENDELYIQVGIVGRDNYAAKSSITQQKIVYGRKWRVERELPTSEIIQTVFLAIKKAREHEVRELFRLTSSGKISTPFNNHHDLPLMAKHSKLLSFESNVAKNKSSQQFLQDALSAVSYDDAKLLLVEIEQRNNGKWLIDINIVPNQLSTLAELANTEITLQLSKLSINEMYIKLMDEFIYLSDSHVEENFSYKTFKRFSKTISVVGLAKLLSQTRGYSEEVIAFESTFQEHNNEIDKTRVPTLDESNLSLKIKSSLIEFGDLAGMIPHEYNTQ